jgi:hypothetical protein
VGLIEVRGCIFDEEQLASLHGFESLDLIGQEAFVNHIHLSGPDKEVVADRIIEAWTLAMRTGWPDRAFRIYRHVEPDEIIIRFHVVRPSLPNWCESGVGIITVGSPRAHT